ncbi:hypothetical protein [Streptomyces parvus]|uniref:hypothetical protein n=1 Tax=Streptomyces parvus TaxID=66428 RepID=UPI003D7130A3
MASTFEGAPRKDYDGNQYTDEFSVRYIDRVENQEAGRPPRSLGAWYDDDRILKSDAFMLVMGDCPEAASEVKIAGRLMASAPQSPRQTSACSAIRQIWTRQY